MKLIADWLEWFEEQRPIMQFNLFMLVVITVTVMVKSMWRLLSSI